MSRIRFTVEDSKVSEVLKLLLDSGIDIKDWEVNDPESKDTTHIHYPYPYYYKEEKDTPWEPWRYIGRDPFYVKTGDEGFDYTGSTGGSDKVYRYKSTTDNKTHTYKPTITTTDSSINGSASESSTTVSLKSELDFPYYEET